IQPIRLRVRELLPRISLSFRLDPPRLGGTFGGANPRHLLGLSLELTLLDLLLLERQDVLHRLFLGASSNHLLLGRSLRGFLATHLLSLGIQLARFDRSLL